MNENELYNYEEVLEQEGMLLDINKGKSMMPLLREGKDLMVIVRKGEERCRKYDAVLYKSGGRYVLHRIIKVRENDYVIVGDNCRRLEYGITDNDILGILTAVVRNGEREIRMDSFTARAYAHIWCDFFPVRAALIFVRECLGKIRRVFKKKDIEKSDN